MEAKKKLVHILMTDYQIDSRVRNETTSLFEEGYEVDVYCLKSKELNHNEIREQINLIRFGFISNKLINFLSAYFFMFFYSLNKKIDCIHAHDANALPIAYLIALIKGVPFIYDSHELWSQSHHSISSKYILNFIAFMEKFFAKKAKRIITVSHSIEKYLEKHFDVQNIAVVRNIPSYVHEGTYDILREKFNINQESKICLYQGVISESRGVELIIKAAINICNKNKDIHFFFLGDGPYLDELKTIVTNERLETRIHILGKINQDDLLKYTMSADIGIHAITNSCLNHEYCLPNKVFEYIHSGLVLVVTNLFELNNFVTENQIGISFKDNCVKSLEESILKIIEDEELFLKFKNNSKNLAKLLTWKNESKELIHLYSEILN